MLTPLLTLYAPVIRVITPVSTPYAPVMHLGKLGQCVGTCYGDLLEHNYRVDMSPRCSSLPRRREFTRLSAHTAGDR